MRADGVVFHQQNGGYYFVFRACASFVGGVLSAIKEFLDCVKGKEDCPEGSFRCYDCFNLRLEKTAQFGCQFGYDYFATTLTLSPLKNAEKINEIGLQVQERTGVKYLVSDFKKKGGYIRSIHLSKDLNLYRQNYCGCEFSKR